LVQARSIQALFTGSAYPVALLLAAVCCFVVIQVRNLPNVGLLSIIGFVTIVIPSIISLVELTNLVGTTGYERAPTALVGSSFVPALIAVMDLVYSFAGHVVYFELINEMSDSSDFPKALWASQIIIALTYVVVPSIVYGMVGDATWLQSPFTLTLPPSAAMNSVLVLIIIHTMMGMSINGIVFVRAFQLRLQPKLQLAFRQRRTMVSNFESAAENVKIDSPDIWTWSAALWWGLWSALTALFVYFVDLVIPWFDDIIGLAAALVATQSNIIWPALFDNHLFHLQMFPKSPLRVLFNRFLMMIGVFLMVLGLFANFYDLSQAERP